MHRAYGRRLRLRPPSRGNSLSIFPIASACLIRIFLPHNSLRRSWAHRSAPALLPRVAPIVFAGASNRVGKRCAPYVREVQPQIGLCPRRHVRHHHRGHGLWGAGRNRVAAGEPGAFSSWDSPKAAAFVIVRALRNSEVALSTTLAVLLFFSKPSLLPPSCVPCTKPLRGMFLAFLESKNT
ncbi:hypothetical protein B0H16DRAFT_648716 [Mycena metata]|uniref:Uncharacterized protein n=1 Tax=Mycena metata TaxID=1033252 RepID=A0AAD7MBF6_9AGAR|nr:hypothetical protein B0H16DRAFT_648716 [Mycena metata]